MSTTRTSERQCRARMLTPAPPFRKLKTIWGVTSLGKAEIPSSATPWSPAKVKMIFLRVAGERLPEMAAKRRANSSSRPSEPSGLVLLSSFAWACARSSVSTGWIRARVSFKSFMNNSLDKRLKRQSTQHRGTEKNLFYKDGQDEQD